MSRTLTATIERRDDLYVALYSDFDVVTQGPSVAEARKVLGEAPKRFFEREPLKEQERRHGALAYL